MRDIARDLGVSIATVSRALNDSPRISASQKKRIQAYAKNITFTRMSLEERCVTAVAFR